MSQLPQPGSRQSNLKKSFKLGIKCLLTACSKEDFSKNFPRFTSVEQEGLQRLFIQVINALHGNIEDEFEELCLETQVGPAFGTVEQLVEEQSVDPLFAHQTNVGDVERDVKKYKVDVKKSKVQCIMDRLEKAEEKRRFVKAEIEQLKKEIQDFPSMEDATEKLRSGNLDYVRSGNLNYVN